MGQLTMTFYIHHIRERYQQSSKEEKTAILNEFCINSGQHRKSALRLLGKRPTPGGRRQKSGRKKIYLPEQLLTPLKTIWFATDPMCGKRLKAALPHWLEHYDKHHDPLDTAIKNQ